jgi:CIC family chloride channel protein
MDLKSLLRRLARLVEVRSQRALVLAALTGALTGLAVAAFEWVTNQQLFARVLDAPLAVQVAAPLVGLTLAALALATFGRGASPSTSDEYIRNFHEAGRRLDLRLVWGRIAGGVATLGFGGAMGYEGPSLYMGAAIGTAVQARWARSFNREDAKVLMVAGAAAGVAAIFKAPATGAVFALEVPYRDDNARRMLLPALLAAAVGYLVFALLLGSQPLFAVAGSPPFDVTEVGGAVVVGLICGVGARLFAAAITWAKHQHRHTGRRAVVRIGAAGVVLGALALSSSHVFGETLSLGSGYRTLDWVTTPGRSLSLILALFVYRLLATTATVAGGGVGGLFIPLVIAGAIVGQAAATTVHDPSTLFPLIGVAAFLGAGYRTPLAGVMFVAETTGRPGFVVPGLIASVASQLVMGRVSVSAYQTSGRLGHLERRFRLPIASAIDGDVATVPPDTTLREFYDHHLLLHRRPEVPVTDGSTYVGMASLMDAQRTPAYAWDLTHVADVVDPTWPVVTPSMSLEQAVRLMEDRGVDTLPVVDDGTFIGVVTSHGILGLDEILGRSEDP